MDCRFCATNLKHVFVDLVNSPPSNSFLTEEQLNEPEKFYPLKVYVCDNCFLVQVAEYKKSQEIFDEKYVYFSSYSKSWLEHCKKYAEDIIKRLHLGSSSSVIEIASNDGYLLQYFKDAGIPVLGVEPTSNTAKVAREKGIETIEEFFGQKLAESLDKKASLLIGNNVLAHVPDINDFVKGLKIILKNEGVITMEFPHLMQLVENNQFDTIYHEHFSYLSFRTVRRIFETHGLEIFDVDELDTHGGSLRIYAKHPENKALEIAENVDKLAKIEIDKGLHTLNYYKDFQAKADTIKYDLLKFLIENEKVAGYGAAAKGNTLLNYCGIKVDMIPFVVDASPHKQDMYLPGSHIPVVREEMLKNEKPNFVLILPWNLKKEIMDQLNYIREWGGKFVVAIPRLEVIE